MPSQKSNRIALAMVGVLSFTVHAETADPFNPACDLGGFTDSRSFDQLPGTALQTRYFVTQVTGGIVEGERTVAKDEPIINVELEYQRVRPSYSVDEKIVHKASWLLAKNLTLGAGESFPSNYRWTSRSGEVYDLLVTRAFNTSSIFFIASDGRLCRDAGTSNPGVTTLVVGNYSTEPPKKLVRGTDTQKLATVGLRVIYLGATGGIMKFNEVLVQGNKPVRTTSHSFDRFAKEILIAGVKVGIQQAKPDSVTVVVEPMAPVDIPLAEMRALAGSVRFTPPI